MMEKIQGRGREPGLKHRAQGYQDFVKEAGEWKVSNHFFLYALK